MLIPSQETEKKLKSERNCYFADYVLLNFDYLVRYLPNYARSETITESSGVRCFITRADK
jgi:hypothetical protein